MPGQQVMASPCRVLGASVPCSLRPAIECPARIFAATRLLHVHRGHERLRFVARGYWGSVQRPALDDDWGFLDVPVRHRTPSTFNTSASGPAEDGSWSHVLSGEPPPELDPFTLAFRKARDVVTSLCTWLTRSISDICIAVLPAHMPKAAIENSVRAGLLLLGLSLLKGILALVLTTGVALLGAYIANQFLGLRLPTKSGQKGPDKRQEGSQPADERSRRHSKVHADERSRRHSRARADGGAYYTAQGWQPQQRNQGVGTWSSARASGPFANADMSSMGAVGRQKNMHDDIIDVYFES